jgi:hypothetical protein
MARAESHPMNRRALVPSLALAIATLSGCPTHSAGSPVPLDSLATRLSSASCALSERCGADLGVYERFLLHEQVTDCPAQLASFVESVGLAAIRAGIADGSIVYHPEIAAECVASYADATCAGVSGIVVGAGNTACTDMFEGTLADGAPCSNLEQCGAQSTCDDSHFGMCPSGVCTHLPQLGEACTTTCGYLLRCASGTCATLLPAGSACTPSGLLECEVDLSCVVSETDPTHGTCGTEAPAGVGEPCGHGCEAGLVCPAMTSICRQPRTDGTCEQTYSGHGDCAGDEQCMVAAGTVAGSCVPLPTVGEACSGVCARGSRCFVGSGGTGTCTVAIADGSACESSATCASSYCGPSGTCEPAPLCRPT